MGARPMFATLYPFVGWALDGWLFFEIAGRM
jgi:hypothetical protein